MVSIAEASAIIASNLFKPKTGSVIIDNAAGKVLGEVIHADRDFPPFHRVAMDGIAINAEMWRDGQREFVIQSTQAAGDAPHILNDKQHCIEIMTGAILPSGTDTVIRYEDVQINWGNAKILTDLIITGQNIHLQGQDAKAHDILLEPGIVISPAEVALLATVGKDHVKTRLFPKAAIVASGNELVDINTKPEPHQIRRSNTYAIQAAMRTIGWEGTQYHLPDEKNILKLSLTKILSENDMIILSGGVSKGKFDYIPEVLAEIGIKKLFHQVSQRPGKPFWFGVSDDDKIIFALPGNPVSTYICFYRFVLPWLWKSLGVEVKPAYAILAEDFSFKPGLTYFLQVKIKNESGRLLAWPDAGGGSGDFTNLKNVDGFLELPLEKSIFKAGDAFPLISFRL